MSIPMHGLLRRAGGGGGDSQLPEEEVPPPSVGHEIGVMFGGFGAMLIGSLLFYLWWRVALRREEKQERERIEDLRRRGLLQDLREKREIGSVDR